MPSKEKEKEREKEENRFALFMGSIIIVGLLCALALMGNCNIKGTCLENHNPGSCKNVGLIF